jgi:hypothetical protein
MEWPVIAFATTTQLSVEFRANYATSFSAWNSTNLYFEIFKCIIINRTWNIFTCHQLHKQQMLISIFFIIFKTRDEKTLYLLYCIHHNVLNWFLHLHDVLYIF